MDNKYNVASPDRDKVNIHENYEVEYWTKELGVSREELQRAVNAVGDSSEKVRQHVNG